MNRVRRPLGGAVGDDPDPTPPEIRRDAILLVDEPDDDEVYDLAPYQPTALRERMGKWRRRYLPLPDEVVHEYLGEDEYVIHTDHPSLRAFLIQNAIFVGILSVAGVVFVLFARGGSIWTTLLVFLIADLVLVILAIKRLNERYISYVITNLRLIRVSGIIGRKLASIPWTRMTGIGYRQSALGRLLGYATIHLESANEESGLREFSDINDPATFHQHLLNMVAAKTGQSGDKSLPPPPTKGVRKSFLQRRRERRAALERAERLAIERERQHRERRASGADERSDDTDGESEVMPEPGPGTGPRPRSGPPQDRGGVYEALSTPDVPDRPPRPPKRHAPGRRTGEARQRDGGEGRRRPGRPPGTRAPRVGPGPGGPRGAGGRSASEKRRPRAGPPPSASRPAPEPDITEEEEIVDTEAPRRPGFKWPGSSSSPADEPRASRPPRQPRPPRVPRGPLFRRRVPKAPPGRGAAPVEDEELLGGLSARDALGAIRRTSRMRPPSAKLSRPRRPSFGRTERPERRPEPPESRQLPAAPDDRPAEDPAEDDED